MDFGFPFFDTLVIPTGTTTGERIEIDGVNGEIRIYDALDDLRIRIGTFNPSAIEFFTGNVNEVFPGEIESHLISISGETYQQLSIQSPVMNAGSSDELSQVALLSRSQDGSEPPTIMLRPRLTTDDLRITVADDSTGTRNQPMGLATLVAGTVTVAHTTVTALSRIIHWRQVAGGTLGHLSIGTITAGTSFVINSSSATDTSQIGYLVLEPI